MAQVDPTTERCSFVVGDEGLAQWTDLHADAWIGFLETHKRLTRALDAELEAEHGLSLSAAEVLGRLAAADERKLRLSDLAQATNLSLSRISRLVDALEDRKLLSRCASTTDARSVEAKLTDAGLEVIRRAQAAHFASVDDRFFAELSVEELTTLARVFGRFAPRAAEECKAGD
jgi:DNA-binding MarR family transcriptional regulator